MGTPKKVLEPIGVGALSDALLLARRAARKFGQPAVRVEALTQLQVFLQPMVEWLDVTANEWGKGLGFEPSPMLEKVRALPLFKRWGNSQQESTIPPVGLTRNDGWVILQSAAPRMQLVSAEWIVNAISEHRFSFFERKNIRPAHFEWMESVGLKPLIQHVAFLEYIESAREGIAKALDEREKRLQLMRANLTSVGHFIRGIDPFEYATEPLPGYAMFLETEHGTSRSTGTYLVKKPVEEEVARSNDRTLHPMLDADDKYYVCDEKRGFSTASDLLEHVGRLRREETNLGMSGRMAITEEEILVLKKYVRGLHNLS